MTAFQAYRGKINFNQHIQHALGLVSAHPETRLFSQFSGFLVVDVELVAFKKQKATQY